MKQNDWLAKVDLFDGTFMVVTNDCQSESSSYNGSASFHGFSTRGEFFCIRASPYKVPANKQVVNRRKDTISLFSFLGKYLISLHSFTIWSTFGQHIFTVWSVSACTFSQSNQPSASTFSQSGQSVSASTFSQSGQSVSATTFSQSDQFQPAHSHHLISLQPPHFHSLIRMFSWSFSQICTVCLGVYSLCLFIHVYIWQDIWLLIQTEKTKQVVQIGGWCTRCSITSWLKWDQWLLLLARP